MLRYVAFSWNPRSAAQLRATQALQRCLLAAPPNWNLAFKSCHLSVYCAKNSVGPVRATPLHDDAGVVLGAIFRRGPIEDPQQDIELAVLSPRDSHEISANAGRPLVECYWGRYIAFISDVAGGKKYVVRDPSGHLPCLKANLHDVDIFFSHMADCSALSDVRHSVNWDYVAVRVIAPALQSIETGLTGVTELQPGECQEILPDATYRRVYWDPVSVARRAALDDPVQTAVRLRQTTKAVVHAWASCYPSVLHRVSGGLDSSIVLSCLQDTPRRPAISCVTYYSCIENAGADIDERAYARLAARHANVKLFELARLPTSRLEVMLQMGCLAVPLIFYDRNVEVDGLEAELARQEQATARFGGDGGDQLFYGLPLPPTAADYVRRHGIGRGIFRLSAQIARRQGYSVWRMLAASIQDGVRIPQWNALDEIVKHREFLTPTALHALKDAGRFLHPSLQDLRGIPPGKLWHIYNLSIVPRFYESNLGQSDDPERVEPLTSQPLVELCLRIPSFILTLGGRDRQLARNAFAQDVPAELLRPRQKAGIDGFVKETLHRNMSFVREALLDGDLVGQKLLDRCSLERALSSRPERIDSAATDIFDYLTMEVWIRTWSSRGRGVPAQPQPARSAGL